MLGVGPESSHDEVKRAFAARAFKYRPDAQADDDAREHAVWRTRELNEAWATLRNPTTRAAYDARLRGDEAPRLVAVGVGSLAGGTARAGAAPPGGRAWFTEPEVADIEPIEEVAAATRPTVWHRLHVGPLAVSTVTVLVVLVLLVRTNNLDNQPNIVQTVDRYGAGTCVLVAQDPAGDAHASEVPCTAPHTGRVRSKVEIPLNCPLNTYNVVLAADRISLCLDR